MDHLRVVYIGFPYIKYSRTSFIPFYYIKEVLNLRPYILGGHPGRPGGLSGLSGGRDSQVLEF
jgi:hypothetical protein